MRCIYIIPDAARIEESMAIAEEYQAYFEYNDFFGPDILDDEQELEKKIAFYEGLERDRSQDTLHGVFLDITIHSQDSLIRKASEYRVRQCMDIAKRLGVRGVIFHTNTIPNFRVDYYRKGWLESNEAFWRQILKEYPTLSVFMENMFDEEPDSLAALAEKMEDEERFGVCLDYAHVNVFGDEPDVWVEMLGRHVQHMHINDNDLKDDLHQSVGQGKIDWQIFDEKMKQAGIESSVLIEVKDLARQRESLEYMKSKKIYPYK